MLAPRYGAATPLRLAANAVMAGCRPEYFPLVLTDYKIGGLSKLLGMLKMDEHIEVHVDVAFAPTP